MLLLLKRLQALLCLLFLLSATAISQQLYVSNKPFTGEVQRIGSEHLVELEPLLKALKLQATVSRDQLSIAGKTVPIRISTEGKTMIVLEQLAAAAGLSIRENADFGHLDVYTSTASLSGSSQDEGTIPIATPGIGTPLTAAFTHVPDGYFIQIPVGYEMIIHLDRVSGLVSASRRSLTDLPDSELSFKSIIIPQQGTNQRGTLMLMTSKLPASVTVDQEEQVVKEIAASLAPTGTLVSRPRLVEVSGKRFYKALAKTYENGKTSMMETYLHLAPSRGLVYWLTLTDDEASFRSSFPALRKSAETFKFTDTFRPRDQRTLSEGSPEPLPVVKEPRSDREILEVHRHDLTSFLPMVYVVPAAENLPEDRLAHPISPKHFGYSVGGIVLGTSRATLKISPLENSSMFFRNGLGGMFKSCPDRARGVVFNSAEKVVGIRGDSFKGKGGKVLTNLGSYEEIISVLGPPHSTSEKNGQTDLWYPSLGVRAMFKPVNLPNSILGERMGERTFDLTSPWDPANTALRTWWETPEKRRASAPTLNSS